ncbi:MAG TPA: hypothetical protein VFN66_01725 [Burkholderiales bacterium]|nr:hypothetical protein [Burkholderiales bacterium]
MSEAWKKLDLEGEGLQSANLKLVQKLKKRKQAYVLLWAFPLGLHRDYLNNPWGAWIYRIGTVLSVTGFLSGFHIASYVLLAFMAAFALYDIRWIEDTVAAINKTLRVQAYKNKNAPAVPSNFRGRYTDESLDDYLQVKERERGGHVAPGTDPALNSRSRAPSFAEQEAMLKELAKSKSGRTSK